MTDIYEFDTLRQELMTRVKQAATALAVKCRLPDAPFTQPKGEMWIDFHVLLGKTKRAELGGGAKGLERTVGVLQFDVLFPEQTGSGPAWRAAEQLKASFNEITVSLGVVGYFTTEAMSITQIVGAPKGFQRLCVDGPIDFWHRNPRA